MIPNDELEALRDAERLHLLPPEALIATIKLLAEEALEYRLAIERVGFRILEGSFTLRNGTTSPIYLEKVDTKRTLDAHDEALYSEAFVLAEAVRIFLGRKSTHRAVDAGMLDDIAMRELTESADRMWLVRTQRIAAARADTGQSRQSPE